MALYDLKAKANLTTNDFSTSKKDSGTIMYGGTVAGSRFQAEKLGEAKTVLGGAVNVSGADLVPIDATAYAQGHFSSEIPGKYILAGITSQLAGQSDTTLASPGSNFGQIPSQHTITETDGVLVADGFRRGKYNHMTGKWDASYPVADASGLWDIHNAQTATSGTADHAAIDSYANVSKLTYMNGARYPVTSDYKPKTG